MPLGARSNNRRAHKPQGLRKKIKTVTIRHAAAVWPDYVLPPAFRSASGCREVDGVDSPRFLPTTFYAVFLPRNRATLDFKRGKILANNTNKNASVMFTRPTEHKAATLFFSLSLQPAAFSVRLPSSVFLLPSSAFSLRLLTGAPFRLASRHHHRRRMASFSRPPFFLDSLR